jgi:hypothetical protein
LCTSLNSILQNLFILKHTCRWTTLLLLLRFQCVRALTHGLPPTSREGMGFTATPDGTLYVLGSGKAGNDLYSFSPATNTWTTLVPSGSAPSPRQGMGFAGAPDGMLYVFGGQAKSGQDISVRRNGAGLTSTGEQRPELEARNLCVVPVPICRQC